MFYWETSFSYMRLGPWERDRSPKGNVIQLSNNTHVQWVTFTSLAVTSLQWCSNPELLKTPPVLVFTFGSSHSLLMIHFWKTHSSSHSLWQVTRVNWNEKKSSAVVVRDMKTEQRWSRVSSLDGGREHYHPTTTWQHLHASLSSLHLAPSDAVKLIPHYLPLRLED